MFIQFDTCLHLGTKPESPPPQRVCCGGFLVAAASTGQRSWIGEPGRGRRMAHGYMLFHRREIVPPPRPPPRRRRPRRVPKSAVRRPPPPCWTRLSSGHRNLSSPQASGGCLTPPPLTDRPAESHHALPRLWACRPPRYLRCGHSRCCWQGRLGDHGGDRAVLSRRACLQVDQHGGGRTCAHPVCRYPCICLRPARNSVPHGGWRVGFPGRAACRTSVVGCRRRSAREGCPLGYYVGEAVGRSCRC